MINKKLDNMFYEIKSDCLELMKEKNVDLEELSFKLGISANDFINKFQQRNKDFSFYLRTYSLLLEW